MGHKKPGNKSPSCSHHDYTTTWFYIKVYTNKCLADALIVLLCFHIQVVVSNMFFKHLFEAIESFSIIHQLING